MISRCRGFWGVHEFFTVAFLRVICKRCGLSLKIEEPVVNPTQEASK